MVSENIKEAKEKYQDKNAGAPIPVKKPSNIIGSKLTRQELFELENKPKTAKELIIDRFICFLPILAGIIALLEYMYIPNYKNNYASYTYVYFIGILITLVLIAFAASFFNKAVFYKLLYKAPFYTLVFVLFTVYDVLTLKSSKLMLPYFPWVDQILNSIISDRAYLLDCIKNSLILLFTGYFTGAIIGTITGIACGYSKRINYWIEPFMELFGAIPSTTWIPIVMVLATSLFKGSVFIIALGVWFAVTLATITGISSIDSAYYDAARTLGAGNRQLIFHIAVPSAIPNIFQGLMQAMSSACTALLVAEMIGVESGLGWYITWQKSWAQYAKMYAAIVIICIIFVLVNYIMNLIKKKVLRWQEGIVK